MVCSSTQLPPQLFAEKLITGNSSDKQHIIELNPFRNSLYIRINVIQRHIHCIINTPVAEFVSKYPKQLTKNIMGPLGSHRLTYGIFPCAQYFPII